jgi:hypothetical protein
MIISRLFFGLARPTLTQQLSAAFAYANPTRTYSNIRSKYPFRYSGYKAAAALENSQNCSRARRARSVFLISAHHQSISVD